MLARTKREDMISYNFAQFIDQNQRNDRNEANVCLVLDAFNKGYIQQAAAASKKPLPKTSKVLPFDIFKN